MCDTHAADPCISDGCDSSLGCTTSYTTSSCDDGDACTTADTCSGGTCNGGPPLVCDANAADPCVSDGCDSAAGCTTSLTTASCDDGDACTTADTCSGGTCNGGPPLVCNANAADPCVSDGCDSVAGCVTSLTTSSCNDGDACTTADTCSGGTCNGGPPLVCDANAADPCVSDGCDSAAGCVTSLTTSSCDDGDACTTADTCSGGTCNGGPPLVCDANAADPCVSDGCDSAAGCVTSLTTASCDDGDACTTGDVCGAGTCSGGSVTCTANAGDPCIADLCDPGSGSCITSYTTSSCDDGDACTTGDTCSSGTCNGGSPLVCNANAADGCVSDGCDSVLGCVTSHTTSLCDDGDACTTADTCSGGTCGGGPPLVCDANAANPCVSDGCDSAAGCTTSHTTSSCNDGDACTTNDLCGSGTCSGGPVTCEANAGNPCVADSCDPGSGSCVTSHTMASCDDGDACTTGDTCTAGTCNGGPPLVCNSNAGDACVSDSCNSGSGCVTSHTTSSCDDGDACTTSDTCSGGTCTGGGAVVCNTNAGDPCVSDGCDSGTGLCTTSHTAASCDDGDACTTGDICSFGTCSSGAPLLCNANAGNPCIADSCNSATGCVTSFTTSACDDGNGCTSPDICSGGLCNPGSSPDEDSDGVVCDLDCDDNDPLNFPGNNEVCDNQDNDVSSAFVISFQGWQRVRSPYTCSVMEFQIMLHWAEHG